VKIFIIASDYYAHLVEPNIILLNRYFPNNEIVCLGYNRDLFQKSFPQNTSFHSLGKQEHFGTSWTTPLVNYFAQLEDDSFIVLIEDFLITAPVDHDRFKLLEDEIKSGRAQKAMLDTHLNKFSTEHNADMVVLNQDASYRTSLHPAIWTKDYFLNFLKPNYTIWDFEVKNMPSSINDGAIIVSLKGDDLLKVTNVYVRGVPVPRFNAPRTWGSNGGITKDDIKLIYRYLPQKYKDQHLEYIEALDENKRYL